MKWWSEFYTDNKERKCWVSWLGDMLFRSFRFKPFIKNFRVHLEHSFPLGHNCPMWNKTSLYTLVYYRWHKFICSPSLHQVCNVYKYCTLNWSCRDKLLLSVDNLMISIEIQKQWEGTLKITKLKVPQVVLSYSNTKFQMNWGIYKYLTSSPPASSWNRRVIPP